MYRIAVAKCKIFRKFQTGKLQFDVGIMDAWCAMSFLIFHIWTDRRLFRDMNYNGLRNPFKLYKVCRALRARIKLKVFYFDLKINKCFSRYTRVIDLNL